MAGKYLMATLVVVLCMGMLPVPLATGLSKSSITVAFHRNSLSTEVSRNSRKLVLRSAVALVEDQQTGELLIQKQVTVVSPIASITKLMTAMVVLDANMDLQESLTIKSGDRDLLRHSRSRLETVSQSLFVIAKRLSGVVAI